MKFPFSRYVSDDPDCLAGRKYVCIGWLPSKHTRRDPKTSETKEVWTYGCVGFHYGKTRDEAEPKLRAWIDELKPQIRVSRQQRELAKARASRKRLDEIALWGLEEEPVRSLSDEEGPAA